MLLRISSKAIKVFSLLNKVMINGFINNYFKCLTSLIDFKKRLRIYSSSKLARNPPLSLHLAFASSHVVTPKVTRK